MDIDTRSKVTIGLTEDVMTKLGDFSISTYHGIESIGEESVTYWDVILSPVTTRIYFLEFICKYIKSLDLDLTVYTDINRPGCIIIH